MFHKLQSQALHLYFNNCKGFVRLLYQSVRVLAIACLLVSIAATPVNADEDNIYQTYGTHNPPFGGVCTNPDCTYPRQPWEPTDPEWPEYWISDWNMYRVFNNYEEFPPPYNNPPTGLEEGADYELSTGTTYYDSTWVSEYPYLPGVGAMREYYQDRCLPIFPIDNKFSCSFISLGDTAFFQTYDKDRPQGMPEYCLFSPLNHPPRRNFISHLPYSIGDSARLDNRVQGYSFWVDAISGKPVQIGASPVQIDSAILFGYGFWSEPSPDASNPDVPPYRHPQSFYFSGVPSSPPDAPIVSQNYTDFSMRKPPSDTWSAVEALDPDELPACRLFNPGGIQATQAPTWADLGHLSINN